MRRVIRRCMLTLARRGLNAGGDRPAFVLRAWARAGGAGRYEGILSRDPRPATGRAPVVKRATASLHSAWIALAAAVLLGAVPFGVVELFRSRLYVVASVPAYLVFHNTVEFFSIMVSLSVFGVGWFTHDQSKDRHALFLACAFLGVGLMDFMHAMSFTGMPDFFTANAATKASQYWIAVRLFGAATLMASAFVLPGARGRWFSKGVLLPAALVVSGLVFTLVNYYPQYLPLTFDPAAGLTRFKVYSEYVIVALLLAAVAAYLARARRTGDPLVGYYTAAFVLLAYSELVFTTFRSMFDTFNALGHVYKVGAFYLVYRAVFIGSVQKPYLDLVASSRALREEVAGRAKAEEEIRKLNRELEQRVLERTALLEAANRELDAFAYSVSHDLRAPLRHVGGFIVLLQQRAGPGLDMQAGRYLAVIAEAANRMGQMIDDLLAFSRMGRAELLRTSVDVKALVREVIDELRPDATGRIIDWTVGEFPPVSADRQMLRLALANLLSNAVKFTRTRPRAEIEIGCTEFPGGTGVVLFVRDNGVGFDPKYADKLFKVFQRLHRAEEFEGTGIGLANVRRIVERHGGRTWAESAPGEGATFFLSLPTPKP
jgi:signal transduction histidine kinase